jgi:hypothetical protein
MRSGVAAAICVVAEGTGEATVTWVAPEGVAVALGEGRAADEDPTAGLVAAAWWPQLVP